MQSANDFEHGTTSLTFLFHINKKKPCHMARKYTWEAKKKELEKK
jgi:hypothetical protein